jgi:hypothetical protein
MRPDDILVLLKQQPFAPFRVHLADGASHEVRHPELCCVGRSTVLIGTPAFGYSGPVFERYDTVALNHITRLELIAPPAASN